ncbi:MAG: DUF1573 domain-containing protein [Planctomycetes bacterium]|nr:DUF1573 domain-containing protein [Planctomycetota bacterium]MBI3834688.1 DUF1573 domain-containing protein [Planctomycetota bacterium]
MNRIAFQIAILGFLVPFASAQVPPPPSGKPSPAGPIPQLFVPVRLKDLGAILDGDKVNISWTIENHGNAPLVIDRTVSTCGCTIVQLSDSDKTVPAGGSLELKATFDSTGRRDTQNKAITVFNNDPVEPELKLQFKADIESLVEMDPDGLVNLRQVRRGDHVLKGVDFIPSGSRKSVTVVKVQPPDDFPIQYEIEPLAKNTGTGQRLRFVIPDTVALGTINTMLKVTISIDGIEREKDIALRGEVVGELVWTPKLIDATRQLSLPGKKLAPVILSSTRFAPFKVERADAGPMLEPSVEKLKKGGASEYSVTVAIRPDAPTGPFAATLRIFTDVPDQPVVEIPVFGIVPPMIEIEPAVILLRDDGTPAGRRRHVKLQAPTTMELNIKGITCDDAAVKFALDPASLTLYRHLRYLDVELTGVVKDVRKAKLTVTTTLQGAEQVEIPVVIQAGPKAEN